MNLSDQVISLELAKKLHELGVKQDSIFYWLEGCDCWLLHYVNYNHYEPDRKIFIENNSPCYSAFTASELLNILPFKIEKENSSFMLFKYDRTYKVEYIEWLCENEINEKLHKTEDTNLVKSLAKMLIHLLENGLIKNE